MADSPSAATLRSELRPLLTQSETRASNGSQLAVPGRRFYGQLAGQLIPAGVPGRPLAAPTKPINSHDLITTAPRRNSIENPATTMSRIPGRSFVPVRVSALKFYWIQRVER